jgi:hypothetical protein
MKLKKKIMMEQLPLEAGKLSQHQLRFSMKWQEKTLTHLLNIGDQLLLIEKMNTEQSVGS